MKLGSNNISKVYLGTNAVQKVYLGTSEVWSATDPDYQAVLNYATAQGYTLPSASQQVKQNQLMLDLKSGGIWSKLDTFAVFATDGNSDFALIDWKRLSQYTAVNSPTFTANQGFQGNGTSSFIDTNFNPSSQGVNYTLNDASFFSWNNTFVLDNFISGVASSSSNCLRMSVASGNQRINMSNLTFTPVMNFGSSSVKFRKISRTNSTTGVASNDTTQTTHTQNSTSIESANQVILRSLGFYATVNVAIFGMGSSLVTENTSQYNAFNTYITSL
jgi:hypothetical protein